MRPTPGYSMRAERRTKSRRLFTGLRLLRELALPPRKILFKLVRSLRLDLHWQTQTMIHLLGGYPSLEYASWSQRDTWMPGPRQIPVERRDRRNSYFRWRIFNRGNDFKMRLSSGYSGRADEVITESSPHVGYRGGPISAMLMYVSCMTEVLIVGGSVMILQ